MNDAIGDLITRIRNAQMRRSAYVFSPVSSVRLGILKVLLEEGYIEGYDLVDCDRSSFKQVKIKLKYDGNDAVISEIKRLSKPGRRVYSPISKIKSVKNGLGINILSTNQGIMSDMEARKRSIGGELLCTVF